MRQDARWFETADFHKGNLVYPEILMSRYDRASALAEEVPVHADECSIGERV
jgi:hypothetical protein